MGRSPHDRRKGPDKWLKSLTWLAVVGWYLMLFALIMIDKAKPEFETIFDQLYGLRLRKTWDLELARFIFYLMIFGTLISSLGLFINAKRHRRQGDTYRRSLIFLLVASVAGAGFYLYFTGLNF